MTDTKICPQCGQPFARPYGIPDGQWRQRRYCSNRCNGLSKQRAFRDRWVGRTADPETDKCECGQPATTVIRFGQLNANGHPVAGWLRVCEDCKQLFEEDEDTCKTKR